MRDITLKELQMIVKEMKEAKVETLCLAVDYYNGEAVGLDFDMYDKNDKYVKTIFTID